MCVCLNVHVSTGAHKQSPGVGVRGSCEPHPNGCWDPNSVSSCELLTTEPSLESSLELVFFFLSVFKWRAYENEGSLSNVTVWHILSVKACSTNGLPPWPCRTVGDHWVCHRAWYKQGPSRSLAAFFCWIHLEVHSALIYLCLCNLRGSDDMSNLHLCKSNYSTFTPTVCYRQSCVLGDWFWTIKYETCWQFR